jgi:hypothetical protein
MADDLNKELLDTIHERCNLYSRIALLDKKIRDLELKIRLINMTEVKSAVKVMTDTWEGAQATSLLHPTIPVIVEEHVETPPKEPQKKEESQPQQPAGWFSSIWGSSAPPPTPEPKLEDDYVKIK